MESSESNIYDTIHCKNDYECKNSDEECNCIETFVEEFVAMQVLFVSCKNNNCIYYMPFGNSAVCNSVNRQEIFKTFKH